MKTIAILVSINFILLLAVDYHNIWILGLFVFNSLIQKHISTDDNLVCIKHRYLLEIGDQVANAIDNTLIIRVIKLALLDPAEIDHPNLKVLHINRVVYEADWGRVKLPASEAS